MALPRGLTPSCIGGDSTAASSPCGCTLHQQCRASSGSAAGPPDLWWAYVCAAAVSSVVASLRCSAGLSIRSLQRRSRPQTWQTIQRGCSTAAPCSNGGGGGRGCPKDAGLRFGGSNGRLQERGCAGGGSDSICQRQQPTGGVTCYGTGQVAFWCTRSCLHLPHLQAAGAEAWSCRTAGQFYLSCLPRVHTLSCHQAVQARHAQQRCGLQMDLRYISREALGVLLGLSAASPPPEALPLLLDVRRPDERALFGSIPGAHQAVDWRSWIGLRQGNTATGRRACHG